MSRREEDIFHADVQRTFASEHGQRVLEELVATNCRKVFNDNAYKMAYNVGKSDLVQHLVALTEQEFSGG